MQSNSPCQGWEVASDHLLCRVDDALQSALVLGSGCSVPDGDGGGEDGLPSTLVYISRFSTGSSRSPERVGRPILPRA